MTACPGLSAMCLPRVKDTLKLPWSQLRKWAPRAERVGSGRGLSPCTGGCRSARGTYLPNRPLLVFAAEVRFAFLEQMHHRSVEFGAAHVLVIHKW
jgi:hypothetical protein